MVKSYIKTPIFVSGKNRTNELLIFGNMGFLRGIQAYGKAFEILFSRKFWWFLLFPFLILLLLFIGGNWLVNYAGDSLYGLIEGQLREWVSGISWLQWVNQAGSIMIRLILKVIYFFLFVAFGGYIILIVMSPVFSWLSERTEAHLTGKAYPFSFRQLAWEIFRGILIALRNMFFQFFLSVFIFFFSFIPIIGLLAPVALFLNSSYFYGFAFIDYAIERKRFNMKESVRYVNRNWGMVTGIGAVFAGCLMIPWISTIVCCFVSLLSVIAGTVALNQIDTRKLPRSV